MAILKEYWSTGNSPNSIGDYAASQSFIATSTYDLESVQVNIGAGSGTGTTSISVDLYNTDQSATPTTFIKNLGTKDYSSQNSLTWEIFTPASTASISSGIEYAIVIEITGQTGARSIIWQNNGGYANGQGSIQYFDDDVWYNAGTDYFFRNYAYVFQS